MAGARVTYGVLASLLSLVQPGALLMEDATCTPLTSDSSGEMAPAMLQVRRQRTTFSAAAWHCHQYTDGQDDAWCQRSPIESGMEYFYSGGNSSKCGGCWCCKRETPRSLALKLEKVWMCHNYTTGQNDEWCQKGPAEEGFEYAFDDGPTNKCGGCWCCKRELPKHAPDKSQVGGENVSLASQGVSYRDSWKSKMTLNLVEVIQDFLGRWLPGWIGFKVARNCTLPEGAIWCEARLKNLPSFWMAVYDWDEAEDWVSYNICQAGYWEEPDMSEFGEPGHMLDIGGNVGFYTFSFAQAGWNVTSFEPMPANFALMSATLCRNPSLAGRVRLNKFGLGAKTHDCRMMRPQGNVGDGFIRCPDEEAGTPLQGDEETFKEVGNFSVRRLDEVLLEQRITEVDLVKVDVEGHESQVFAGAPNFLTQYRPRLIKSEVWDTMVGTTGPASGYEYLAMFENAGYKPFADNKCQSPINSKAEMDIKHALDIVYCM